MKHKNLRILSLFLAASLLLAMAGCGTTEPQTTEPPAPTEEYTLPREEGCNQLTFYWKPSTGSVKDADIWSWIGDGAGKGYILYPCEYGYKAVINVPEGVTEVGFIVRYNCSDPGGTSWGEATKDFAEDRFATMTGADTVIYLKGGDPNQYYSADGGKTLEQLRKMNLAGMMDFNTIRYNLTPAVAITSLDQVKVFQEGREIPVTGLSSLNNKVVTGLVTLGEKLDVSKNYEIQIEGFPRQSVMPTGIFDCEEFIRDYTYDGDDLGAVIHGTDTTFKVWAPTASKIVLNLYTAGNDVEAFANIEMVKGEHGVWSHTQPDCGHGTYYTYTATTSAGTQVATDPYAKAAGVNGDRSMVVDLELTDPADWANDRVVTLQKYTDAVIWEVHVRDFSNKIADSRYPGKYLAFTETGLTNKSGVPVGMDYLANLGITHVHLLPVYDYATVDERNPDSGFNWGYDPKNYNVPEGSYSTDPYNGQVRITEYKQMVQALHNAGLGVVMDVVYNHTYDGNSAFNRLVPYYYYRYTPAGANSNASGCGNDTASERYMFRKFMVDSVSYWAKEYNLDGFRFDLMGLHDLETMRQVEAAVHAINPNAIIYGEGWTMGATGDGSPQANQTNISKIEATNGAAGSISVFNDVIRDGLKGSVFDKLSQGYVSGAFEANAGKVQFSIAGSGGTPVGGWRVSNASVINYMSAHDNHTLWDKLALSNADNTVDERLAMNRLGAAIMMVSQGTPFWQAGEEMLRTKGGDENSYKSSDEVNNIDWEALVPGSDVYEMMEYYKGLIELRKSYDIFRSTGDVTVTFGGMSGGGMSVLFEDTEGRQALVLINPSAHDTTYTLEGQWALEADGSAAGSKVLAIETGSVTVEARSIRIYPSRVD